MENSKTAIGSSRSVKLDEHESVRSHVQQQICDEVARLEQRIEALRLTGAPHAAIMISTYQRMIGRKKGFLQNWDM
ncbi:hypothetical protein C7H09_02375 [Marinobacter fuscus]|uniref:Uncharacterized protein n=1 Tax=Marinobacter fuscus TaxID=2109942 RepID=A0A2T1KTR0_9GAMM|nr:hypothetical protein [Marinobacter fuscus]PSF13470.1 hypothetical protein C7H09_02375 [Marinobacter fuscus]